jgi:hypothetical protein
MKRISSPGSKIRRSERAVARSMTSISKISPRSSRAWRDRREIRNRLAVLLTHLLKCAAHHTKPSSSWLGTIAEQRDGIADLIEDSPSLSDYPSEILERCYPKARRNAARQMRLPESAFPERCPFALDEILDPRWLPRPGGRVIT